MGGNVSAEAYNALEAEGDILQRRNAMGLPLTDPAAVYFEDVKTLEPPALAKRVAPTYDRVCGGNEWVVYRRLPSTQEQNFAWQFKWGENGEIEISIECLPLHVTVQSLYFKVARGENTVMLFPVPGKAPPGKLEITPPAKNVSLIGQTEITSGGVRLNIPYPQLGLVVLADLYRLTK